MTMSKRITVYLGATTPRNPAYVQAVRELGREIARRGWTLVFGGSREGTMTVLADEVLANGGRAVGIFTKSLPIDLLYQGLTETHITENLAERKATMLALADAVVALPGSFGTWDELFDALEQAKIDGIHNRPCKPIGVLNVDGFYDGLLALLRRSIDEGFTTPRYAALLKAAPTVPQLLSQLFEN